jgi:hypothetical protein
VALSLRRRRRNGLSGGPNIEAISLTIYGPSTQEHKQLSFICIFHPKKIYLHFFLKTFVSSEFGARRASTVFLAISHETV